MQSNLHCQSCGKKIDRHDTYVFIAPWAIKCLSCYLNAGNADYGDIDHYRGRTGISPRGHTQESFALAMWQQKRRQIEAWLQENGLNVPVELLDECEDWRMIWMAKFHQTVGRKPDILSDIMLQHQLKETASGR